ncbi:response regulator [Vibrio sp.]|nr:response regulator [Vibrio sp.]
MQKKILIVDDSATSSSMFVSILYKLGYQDNQTCSDPTAAIRLCQHNAFDVLVIDYHLNSTMNGVELADYLIDHNLIKREAGFLFISGDHRSSTILEALHNKRASFMIKPINPNIIKDKLNTLFYNQEIFNELYALEQTSFEEQFDKATLALEECSGHREPHRITDYLVSLSVKYKRYEELQTLCQQRYEIPTFKLYHIVSQYELNQLPYQEALIQLKALTEANPLLIDIHLYTIELHKRNEQPHQAIMAIENVIKLLPHQAEIILSGMELCLSERENSYFINFAKKLIDCIIENKYHWQVSFAHYLRLLESFYIHIQDAQIRHEFYAENTEIIERLENNYENLYYQEFAILNLCSQFKVSLYLKTGDVAKRDFINQLRKIPIKLDSLSPVLLIELYLTLSALGEVWQVKRYHPFIKGLTQESNILFNPAVLRHYHDIYVESLCTLYEENERSINQLYPDKETLISFNTLERNDLIALHNKFPFSSEISLLSIEEALSKSDDLPTDHLHHAKSLYDIDLPSDIAKRVLVAMNKLHLNLSEDLDDDEIREADLSRKKVLLKTLFKPNRTLLSKKL